MGYYGNIDQMLMERHLAKKARRGSSKNRLKGPRKRTTEDDERFQRVLRDFCMKRCHKRSMEKMSYLI